MFSPSNNCTVNILVYFLPDFLDVLYFINIDFIKNGIIINILSCHLLFNLKIQVSSAIQKFPLYQFTFTKEVHEYLFSLK